MARPLWSGSLSFGLVNVPVELHSAVRDRQLHFTQLNERTGSPIEVHRFCTEEDREVDWEDVAHGYELEDGREVVLSDEELEAAAPRRTRTIDVEQFSALEEIDPALLDHPYVLLPARGGSEGTTRAYLLLHGVMADGEKVAIGRFVLRSKQYLAAIRADGPLLVLSTMRFHDELRSADGVGAPSGASARPKPRALREAVRLIESMSGDFDPASWRDRHRARLRRTIERKASGEKIAAPRRDAPSERGSPDLMEALEASIAKLAA
jgi:DNA end-binding protein Ku